MTSTLVKLIHERSSRTPEKLAYVFRAEGKQDVRFTYEKLHEEARRIASLLAMRVAPGSRVMMIYNPGLEFVAAYFGCLYAGVIAVPVYPPAPPRFEGFVHVERVFRNAGAELILTSQSLAGLPDVVPEVRERFDGVPWLVTDRSGQGDADSWRDPGVKPSTVAFLQYTSGSTADPRGVIVRHEHLLANQRAIHWYAQQSEQGVMVSWLPMYHDMGLIGAVMYPLYLGMPCYLMSALEFLQHPVRWLKLISDVRGTISGGPNFAYELCVKRISEAERAGLDLSSWEVAFNGSEPIKSDTVRSFETVFASSGLRPGAVVGCYGMAEATLLITGTRNRNARFTAVNRDELELGRVIERPPLEIKDENVSEIVTSGGVPPDHDVRVVDPETRIELPPAHVGEIWFRGASVAQGYWRQAEETAASFGGVLASEMEPGRYYLRTGDMGMFLDGQLYITGRRKDLLVVRGRNIHPQDVEQAAQGVDAQLRPGRGVAFPMKTEDGESVALIQEINARGRHGLDKLAQMVREAVLGSLQVTLAAIYFVPPHAVRRTTSGKLRRRATQAALAAGELKVLHQDLEFAVGLIERTRT